jgi:hypothetical protein
MAATQGVSAFGTTIKMHTTGVTWLTILEPKDISGPNITSEFIDFTHQQSPSGFRERKPSFKSSGDVTFKVNYVHSDTSHQALYAAAKANPPTLDEFALTFPDNSQFRFSAYTSLAWTNPLNGPEEMAVTLSITGDLDISAGSPSASASAS